MSGKRPGKKPVQKKPVDPAAAAAKRERRAQAAEIRAKQERTERRRKALIQSGVVAAVVLVVVGVVFAVMKGRTPDYVAPPSGFDEDGRHAVGAAAAPVTLTVVEDFSCPHCAAANALNGDLLASYAAGDQVRIEYRPIAFLDTRSNDNYATRALNTAVCVVEDNPDNWSAIHQALMDNQPPQGDGLSNSTLTDLAVGAGADRDAVAQCITDVKHEDWIDYTTHQATSESDFSGTPATFVNGKRVDAAPAAIDAAVQEALAQ